MQIKTFFSILAAIILFVSCDDSTNEYYTTYFYPNTTKGIETYADQTTDTTVVVSTNSWSLTNNCDWCTVSCDGQTSPIQMDVPEGYIKTMRVDFTLRPNTTGEVRTNAITVTSSYNKIGNITTYLVQYPYLHISNPSVLSATKDNVTTYTFTLTVPANGKLSDDSKPSISFLVYSNDATLESSDTSWLIPARTKGFLANTAQNVELDIAANTTGEERTATLTLTSNDVSTPITIKQSF